MSNEIRISETSPNLFIKAIIEQASLGNTFVENTFYSGRTAHNAVFLETEKSVKPQKASKPRKTTAKVTGGSKTDAG